MFKMTLERLKTIGVPKSQRDQSIYNMFLKTYGTHYISNIKLGAKFSVVTILDDKYKSEYSYEHLTEQISLNFKYDMINLGLNSTSDEKTQSISEEFKNHSNSHSVFVPERGSESVNGSIWLQNAYENPGIIGLEASFLSELIEVLGYEESASYLKKTIEYYIKNGNYPDSPDKINFDKLSSGPMSQPFENLKWIPGLDKVGCGYDITSQAYKSCFFDFEEGPFDIWTNPLDRNLTYKVPKGFFAMNNAQSVSTNSTYLFKKLEHFIEESRYSIHEDDWGFLGFGASSQTSTFYHYYEYFYKKEFSLALSMLELDYYSLYTSLAGPLSSMAQMSIAKLPEKYENSTKLIFKQFIDTYGTHVVLKANMGGLIWSENWYDSCLEKIYSEDWVKNEVRTGLFFFGLISETERSEDHTKIQRSPVFVQNSVMLNQLYGGTTNLPIEKWNEWIPSVKSNLQPTSQVLVPIYKILPQGLKREALKMAMKEYRQQSSEQIEKTISMFKGSKIPSSICKETKSTGLLKPVNGMEVKTVRQTIREFFETSQQKYCPLIIKSGIRCETQNKNFNMKSSKFNLKGSLLVKSGSSNLMDEVFQQSVGISYNSATGQSRTKVLKMVDSDSKNLITEKQNIIVNETFIIDNNYEDSSMPMIREASYKIKTIFGGIFQDDASSEEILRKYATTRYKAGVAQQYFDLFSVKFQKNQIFLEDIANSAILRLPDQYSEDYVEFLELWGDVISLEVKLGGLREVVVGVPPCTEDMSVQDHLLKELQNVDQVNVDKIISVVKSERKVGGDPECMKYEAWSKSLELNPVVTRVKDFIRWTDLIKEEKKKNNFVRAYEDLDKKRKEILNKQIRSVSDSYKENRILKFKANVMIREKSK